MTWVKLDDQFRDHPKIIKAGPMAAWLWVCGLSYCSEHLTDGLIPRGVLRMLADLTDVEAQAERLVEVGLWERTEDGYNVHDYLVYQPAGDQVRAERSAARERMQRLRSGEVHPNNQRSSSSPSPSPSPSSPVLEDDSRKQISKSEEGVEGEPGRAAVADAQPAKEKPRVNTAPKPEKPKGVNLKPIFDAFQEAGLDKPIIPQREVRAAGELLTLLDGRAELIAECVQDVRSGAWPRGDPQRWTADSLTFSLLTTRIGNWLEWRKAGKPRPEPNGFAGDSRREGRQAVGRRYGQQSHV